MLPPPRRLKKTTLPEKIYPHRDLVHNLLIYYFFSKKQINRMRPYRKVMSSKIKSCRAIYVMRRDRLTSEVGS